MTDFLQPTETASSQMIFQVGLIKQYEAEGITNDYLAGLLVYYTENIVVFEDIIATLTIGESELGFTPELDFEAYLAPAESTIETGQAYIDSLPPLSTTPTDEPEEETPEPLPFPEEEAAKRQELIDRIDVLSGQLELLKVQTDLRIENGSEDPKVLEAAELQGLVATLDAYRLAMTGADPRVTQYISVELVEINLENYAPQVQESLAYIESLPPVVIQEEPEEPVTTFEDFYANLPETGNPFDYIDTSVQDGYLERIGIPLHEYTPGLDIEGFKQTSKLNTLSTEIRGKIFTGQIDDLAFTIESGLYPNINRYQDQYQITYSNGVDSVPFWAVPFQSKWIKPLGTPISDNVKFWGGAVTASGGLLTAASYKLPVPPQVTFAGSLLTAGAGALTFANENYPLDDAFRDAINFFSGENLTLEGLRDGEMAIKMPVPKEADGKPYNPFYSTTINPNRDGKQTSDTLIGELSIIVDKYTSISIPAVSVSYPDDNFVPEINGDEQLQAAFAEDIPAFAEREHFDEDWEYSALANTAIPISLGTKIASPDEEIINKDDLVPGEPPQYEKWIDLEYEHSVFSWSGAPGGDAVGEMAFNVHGRINTYFFDDQPLAGDTLLEGRSAIDSFDPTLNLADAYVIEYDFERIDSFPYAEAMVNLDIGNGDELLSVFSNGDNGRLIARDFNEAPLTQDKKGLLYFGPEGGLDWIEANFDLL